MQWISCPSQNEGPALKSEGIARELVNRIQNIRKDSGFEVMDRVQITIQDDEILKIAVNQNLEYIKRETLTNVLNFEQKLEEGTEIIFDDIISKLLIKKVYNEARSKHKIQ